MRPPRSPPPRAAPTSTVARLTAGLAPRPPAFPPGPPGDIAPAFVADPLATLEALSARHGGIVGTVFAGERVVIVGDPAAAGAILGDTATYGKEGTAFLPGPDVTGAGLLTVDGDEWRAQRAAVAPSFRRAAVESYGVAVAAAAADAARALWSPPSPSTRDLYADFHAVTLDVTTRALFGVAGVGGGDHDIVAAVDAAFTHLAGAGAALLRLPGWLPSPGRAKFEAAVAAMDSAVNGIIRQRRAVRAAAADGAPAPPACLLDALLDAPTPPSDAALRDQLVTMLTAGAETSAIALTWAAALLAAHPAAAAAATAAADEGGASSSSSPPPLYLEAVMLETLRLAPPAYIVGRCAAAGADLPPYALPPGTTLLVSPYLLHRDPTVWHAPRTFSPDRWLPLLADAPPDGPGGLRCGRLLASNGGLGPNGAYAPFGAGPRACVGASLAALEFVVVLRALLRAATITKTAPDAPFPAAAPTLTLRPAGRVELVVTRR